MLAAQGLPDYGTPFIGRDDDLERIDRVVADGASLVSLVGPGGVGKTRLAVEHARRSASEVPVAFCELTPTRTAEDVSGGVQEPEDRRGHATGAPGDFRCRCIDRCQQLLQSGGFFGELGVVLGGVELGQRHGRASCRGFRSFAAKPTSGRTVGERPRTCTV